MGVPWNSGNEENVEKHSSKTANGQNDWQVRALFWTFLEASKRVFRQKPQNEEYMKTQYKKQIPDTTKIPDTD